MTGRVRGQPLTDIFVVDANGSKLQRVTHVGNALDPVWSPDGRTIAFDRGHLYISSPPRTEGLTASIWAIRPDGRDLRRLTRPVRGQGDLPGSFSTDGRWLAFTRTEPEPLPGTTNGIIPNNSSVYLLNTRNGALRLLASQSSDPSFEPDGKWIALVSTRDHNGTHPVSDSARPTAYSNDLYLVDPTGSRWKRLTHSASEDEGSPSFSPNGTQVAFYGGTGHNTRGLLEINRDGTCPTMLRKDSFSATARTVTTYDLAVWRPGATPGRLRCHHS